MPYYRGLKRDPNVENHPFTELPMTLGPRQLAAAWQRAAGHGLRHVEVIPG